MRYATEALYGGIIQRAALRLTKVNLLSEINYKNQQVTTLMNLGEKLKIRRVDKRSASTVPTQERWMRYAYPPYIFSENKFTVVPNRPGIDLSA